MKHSPIGPSAAERWLACPGSVALSATQRRHSDSSFAAEGTAAHELAEILASIEFGKTTVRRGNGRAKRWERDANLTPEQVVDMRVHCAAWVEFLKERMTLWPNSSIMFEQTLDTGITGSYGTSDVVIVSPRHVEIIDFKYGMGIPVYAEGNPQIRLYALGALDEYGDVLGETEVVTMGIYQPRLSSVSLVDMSPADLRAWREEIRPIAASALDGTGPIVPSEDACRFCPAAGVCRARMEVAVAQDFAYDPELLSPAEIGDALQLVPQIRNWCDAITESALRKAYSEDTPIPGWKVVLSGGRRVITNEEEAIAALAAAGYEYPEIINRKIKGIGDLTKLLGSDFDTVLGAHIERTPGKPAMALEDDKRPSISPNTEAAKEFGS